MAEKSTRNFSAVNPGRFSDYSVAVQMPLAVVNTVSLTLQGSVGGAGGECATTFQKMMSPVSAQYYYTGSCRSTAAL